MNIIGFWIRILFGSITLIMTIAEFSSGKTMAALAELAITMVVGWPIIYMLYLRQKPLPAHAFSNSFGVQRIMKWVRFVCGYGIVVGFSDHFTIQETGKIGCIIVGLFLASPLSAKVFTYRLVVTDANKPNQTVNNGTILGLIFLRSYGLMSILIGFDPVQDPGLPGAQYWFFFSGIGLVFARQLSLVLNGKKGAVPLWATVQTVASKEGSPSPSPLPVGQPIEMPSIKKPSPAALRKLSTDYSTVLQLEAAQKGIAFKQFLSDLFSLYDFSVVSKFQLQDHEIAGSFEMEGQTYILTARFQSAKTDHDQLLIFNGKVEAKSTWARGIFISNAGFTQDGLETFSRGKRTSIIGMDGQDLWLILEGRISLTEAIKRKARRAVETNHSFVALQKLL